MSEEEVESGLSGEEQSDDGSDVEDTRTMVREQNRKKKKSGGFQAMGM